MKKLSIYFLAISLLFLAVPFTQALPFQLYQADNIWNVPIDTLPVDAKSSTYITNGLPNSFLYIAGGITPINVVTSAQPKQYLTSIEYPEFSDNIPYPIPDNPKIEDSGGDHHFLIYESDTNLLYEMYQPVQARDGTWSAYDAQRYDLSSYALRDEPYPSVTASGLPMTPGLITYEEIERGSINHSMLLWLYNTRDTHVWPARANGNWNNPSYPPFGQRFRLKASFDTTGYSPVAKTILEGLKKYGAMVSDNSGDTQAWVISADADPRWKDDGSDGQNLFNEMKNVHGSDFEAVDVSSLMINKDSGQARIPSLITPIPTPTPTLTPKPTTTPTPAPTQAPTPSLTVTSPNGGESWKRSTSHTIGWSYSGSPGSKVNIVLMKRGTNVGTIASNVPIGSSGKGSYIWKIPSNRQTGTDYKITVQSTSQPAVKDTSNNYFTIRY